MESYKLHSKVEILSKTKTELIYKAKTIKNETVFMVREINKKVATEEYLNTVKNEIEIIKQLNHQNIVGYRGKSETNNVLQVYLEYCEKGQALSVPF